ncbi:unnamed protein product [Rangifer tarandus platyrhynchus]|uniref:Uncharacterized protein n=1 Tax=Rangifer tarandus platyrhynchus TaxID=3082113 RepID=A0AC59YK26_RANTA
MWLEQPADGAVAEESGESSRLGGVFQEAVTLAVGLPDTVQDAQLKLNFRSTTNTDLALRPQLFFYLAHGCDYEDGCSPGGRAPGGSRRSGLRWEGLGRIHAAQAWISDTICPRQRVCNLPDVGDVRAHLIVAHEVLGDDYDGDWREPTAALAQ